MPTTTRHTVVAIVRTLPSALACGSHSPEACVARTAVWVSGADAVLISRLEDAVALRPAHARQDEAGRTIVGIEDARLAIDFAIGDACPAGLAHAGPAREAHFDPFGFSGLE